MNSMDYLDLTLPTPAENLALDEALLVEAEAADSTRETLRLWEPQSLAVIVGRSSRVAGEVRTDVCRDQGVPILRRSSGGAAVVIGPGCLMYALVLSLETRPELRVVDEAHRFVLGSLGRALKPLAPEVRCRGISDLVVGEKKFSGNSIRMKRDWMLYHGTLLYDFPLDLIERLLTMPPREPVYRSGRPHREFVANLAIPAEAIRAGLRGGWEATEPCPDWPRTRTEQLVLDRYSRREWNEQ
jgi:lipoate---protein ligase